MKEFEVEIKEQAPLLGEYMMVFAHGLAVMANAIDESGYKPEPKQIKAMTTYLKDKIKDLEKWS